MIINIKSILQQCIEQKEVTLRSGEQSSVYVNCSKALTAAGLAEGAKGLLNRINALDDLKKREDDILIDGVLGIPQGGVPWAAMIAAYSYMNFRHTKLNLLISKGENFEGPSGIKNVVLIEDVCTTGNSVKKEWDKLVDAGYNPVGVVCLVDRGGCENLKKDGITTYCLYTLDELCFSLLEKF